MLGGRAALHIRFLPDMRPSLDGSSASSAPCRLLGGGQLFNTKILKARRFSATHCSRKSDSPETIQASRTRGHEAVRAANAFQIGIGLVLEADHAERRRGPYPSADAFQKRTIASDDAGLLSLRTRRRHGGAEIPTLSASSTFVIRPSSCMFAHVSSYRWHRQLPTRTTHCPIPNPAGLREGPVLIRRSTAPQAVTQRLSVATRRAFGGGCPRAASVLG